MIRHPQPLGIYVHVPFCPRRCSYCDFFVVAGAAPELERRLARALVGDLLLAAEHGLAGRAADTLYFGGGTPSRLTAAEVGAILTAARRSFNWHDAAEVTLEANPERLTPEHLGALRAAGVNRLSLGVQTLDGATLRSLGRLHGEEEVHAAARAARAAGFDNLSFDLICGLPGLEAGRWARDLERLVGEHAPEHVSVYTLEMDKQMPLRREVEAGRVRLPADEETMTAFESAARLLERLDYERYEVSSFARPGFRSAHNLKYWTDAPFLGIGPSAWSYLDGRRLRRAADVERYLGAVEAGEIPGEAADEDDPDRRLAEAVILGLRLREGVDLALCGRVHGKDAWAVYGERVRRLEAEGWLETSGDRVRLTPAALPVANAVWSEFL